MYFADRSEAGYRLARELDVYQGNPVPCAVIALSDGSVLVAEQIAIHLRALLALLLTEKIDIPGENLTYGTVDQYGTFVTNSQLSHAELDDYYAEFHGYIEDQKRVKHQQLVRLLSEGGILDIDMLRDHIVILAADGLEDATVLDAAAELLKPIRTHRLIIVTPVASVPAVDRMHIMADELHVLNATDNFLGVDHYYESNVLPTHEETIVRVNRSLVDY